MTITCRPFERPVIAKGDVQLVKLAPSTEQLNDDAVKCFAANEILVLVLKVGSTGLVVISILGTGGGSGASGVGFAPLVTIDGTGSVAASGTDSSSSLPAVTASISYENPTDTMAQLFTPTEAFKLADVTAVLKKGSTASIETVMLRLRDSASNVPGASDLATASIAGSIVGTSNTEVNFRFSAPVQLTANTTYWLIIDPGTNNISNGTLATYFYWIGSYSDTWSGGKLILGTDSFNSWNDIGYDANFSVKKCNVIP